MHALNAVAIGFLDRRPRGARVVPAWCLRGACMGAFGSPLGARTMVRPSIQDRSPHANSRSVEGAVRNAKIACSSSH
jgi:hypothetical protein